MWTIHGQHAQLQTINFSGTLDLAVPAAGLKDLCFSEQPLPSVQLLGVSLAQQLVDVSQISNHYARDNCLVANYGDVLKTDCHAQIQWRCLDPRPELWLGGLELIVSFEAPLLTQLPEWRTTSEIPERLILSPGDGDSLAWNPVSRQGDDHQQDPTLDEDRFRMLLCRFPEQNLSYLEMVHCQASWLQVFLPAPNSATEIVRWGLQIPDDHLEKGVILRRVLRGVFLPLEQDEVLAREVYQHFLTVSPPLN